MFHMFAIIYTEYVADEQRDRQRDTETDRCRKRDKEERFIQLN